MGKPKSTIALRQIAVQNARDREDSFACAPPRRDILIEQARIFSYPFSLPQDKREAYFSKMPKGEILPYVKYQFPGDFPRLSRLPRSDLVEYLSQLPQMKKK